MRLLNFIIILMALHSVCWASTKELDTNVMRATHFARAPMAKDERKALAAAALTYWKNFDSRIPRNSPLVTEWLTNEMKTTDTARIGRVLNTPEYAFLTLSETSSNCVKLFELLNDVVGEDSLRELYIWTKTLSCYKDPSALLIYLQRGSLSNGRYDGEFSLQHFSFYHDTVTGAVANEIEAGAR